MQIIIRDYGWLAISAQQERLEGDHTIRKGNQLLIDGPALAGPPLLDSQWLVLFAAIGQWSPSSVAGVDDIRLGIPLAQPPLGHRCLDPQCAHNGLVG